MFLVHHVGYARPRHHEGSCGLCLLEVMLYDPFSKLGHQLLLELLRVVDLLARGVLQTSLSSWCSDAGSMRHECERDTRVDNDL